MNEWVVFSAFLLVMILIISRLAPRLITVTVVHDFEAGILYRKGRFAAVLPAGRYVCFETFSSILRYDLRTKDLYVPNLQIITKDKIAIKVTVKILFRVTDPLIVQNLSFYLDGELRNYAEAVVFAAIAPLTLDEFLERPTDMDASMVKSLAEKTHGLGFEIKNVILRDVILPANLKRAYAGLLEAKKEALKKLEQARGEQAVLRNLANSSVLYDKNPALFKARLLQALSSGQNSIVFNVDGAVTITPQSTLHD